MGKPPTELVLVPETACALGLTLTDTHAVAVVIDAVGAVLEKTDTAFEGDLSATLKSVLSGLTTSTIKLVGVGVTRAGEALEKEELEALEREIGLGVTSASRAGAGARRERYFGAAQTLDTFMYLNVDDDLSSAALLGRRLLAPENQLSGLAEVLGGQLATGSSAWDANLPILKTTLLAAEQLLTPEALIVGGNASETQLTELTSALQDQGTSTTPILKGFNGPEEHALAAATLPLYSVFDVASPPNPQS